jgi:hypothetical protein
LIRVVQKERSNTLDIILARIISKRLQKLVDSPAIQLERGFCNATMTSEPVSEGREEWCLWLLFSLATGVGEDADRLEISDKTSGAIEDMMLNMPSVGQWATAGRQMALKGIEGLGRDLF